MSRSIDTREKVLAAAHRVIGTRLDHDPPAAHDDAEAEYAEDQLDDAAALHARTVLQHRLEKGVPRSAIEASLREAGRTLLLSDAGGDAGLPHAYRQLASEAAVMELALVEIIRRREGDASEDLDIEEARGIAADALPEGAARRATYGG